MMQSFVGRREQELSALMHAIRQFHCGRFARFARATVIRRGSPIRAFPPSYRAAQLSGYLRQRIQLRAIAAVTQ
jgi:hypothetical protein